MKNRQQAFAGFRIFKEARTASNQIDPISSIHRKYSVGISCSAYLANSGQASGLFLDPTQVREDAVADLHLLLLDLLLLGPEGGQSRPRHLLVLPGQRHVAAEAQAPRRVLQNQLLLLLLDWLQRLLLARLHRVLLLLLSDLQAAETLLLPRRPLPVRLLRLSLFSLQSSVLSFAPLPFALE